MATPLSEFVLQEPRKSEDNCTACGSTLNWNDPHPPQRVPHLGYVCGDCATEGISRAIDEHPVGRPMSRVS